MDSSSVSVFTGTLSISCGCSCLRFYIFCSVSKQRPPKEHGLFVSPSRRLVRSTAACLQPFCVPFSSFKRSGVSELLVVVLEKVVTGACSARDRRLYCTLTQARYHGTISPMRTIVDLPDEQIRALDAYSKKNGVSRAEAVRRAVARFLPQRPHRKLDVSGHPAFGSWKRRSVDSVEFQRKLRAEWGKRS